MVDKILCKASSAIHFLFLPCFGASFAFLMSGLTLSTEQLNHLQFESAEWCRYNGLVMRAGSPASHTLSPGR